MAGIIDITTGEIILAEDLVIRPGYTFREFQKTQYYSGQDETRVFGICGSGKTFCLNGDDYGVSLWFRSGRIFQIHLCYSGPGLPQYPGYEAAREFYLEILKKNGLGEHNSFHWGGIEYNYDPRMGDGCLLIWYNKHI